MIGRNILNAKHFYQNIDQDWGFSRFTIINTKKYIQLLIHMIRNHHHS